MSAYETNWPVPYGNEMQILDLNVPISIQAQLKRIQAFIPGAVIAGGYLRDLYLGKKHKDIDVFIPHTENINEKLLMLAGSIEAERDGITQTVCCVQEMHGAKYMPQAEVTRVWDFEMYDYAYNFLVDPSNKGVQIIMLKEGLDIEERIKGYDFGICQIYYDGQVTKCSDAFKKDVDNKTFTLVVCEDAQQLARSMRRWERFQKRYSDYSLKFDQSILLDCSTSKESLESGNFAFD